MSTFHRYLLGVVACLLVLAAFQFAPAQVKEEPIRAEKWEYKIHHIGTNADEALKTLNPLGAQGWVLVSVTHNPNDYPVAYFKRPISADAAGK